MHIDAAVGDGGRQRVERCVIDAIASFGADRNQVTAQASLAALDTDELDILELFQIVDAQFGVRLHARDIDDLVTVGDAIELVVARLR